MKNMEKRELYQAFQQEFPLESLKNMPLEKYTNLNREDSFCYWIESKTQSLGSFWGGSSYKFLIYRYNKKPTDSRVVSDDEYAWYANLDKDNPKEAYKVVLDEIIKVATLAKAGDYEAIDNLDRLGHSYKWKIAFLYSDEKLIPVYNREMLISFASHLGMQHVNKAKTVEIQRFLIEKKGNQDVYTFCDDHKEFIKQESKAVSFNAVKAALIEKLEDNERFVVKKSGKNYLWIGTKDELIGHSACHYEINTDNNANAGHKKDYVYVEMHHEGRGTAPFKALRDVEGVKSFRWLVYGERLNDEGWYYKDENLDNLTEQLLQALSDLDDVVGEKAREIVLESKRIGRDTVAFWIYSPGEQAVFWDEYYQNGIMGLGWNKIDDLREHINIDDIISLLKINYGADNSQVKNARMLYDFAFGMKPGDIVFAKKGRSMIVGRGVVTSDYYYDDNHEIHPHLRKVNWTHKGEWKSDNMLAMKTLTNISRDTDLVKQLNKLIDGDSVKQGSHTDDKSLQKKEIIEPYTNNKFLEEVFITRDEYNKLRNLLLRKKNLILQGAPGVGKTFAARRLAYAIMGEKAESRVMQVQFHQNYSYEDFVMGYKPNENGGFYLSYGIFHKFCRRASIDKEHPYFFIIDEVNRGNLSKIFGELLMLIENDYRDKPIQLSYNDETFAVPSNIYIIGMMNTADRSLAMIDYALRRRFSFFEMRPGFETDAFNNYILGWSTPKLRSLINAIIELNKVIADDDSLGSGFCIGHSYLCNFDDSYDLESIVEYDIIPMLREYWFDNDERFNQEAQKLRNALK
jgi:MoxR-like ATPase